VSSFCAHRVPPFSVPKNTLTEFLKQALADHMPYYQPTKSTRTDRSRPPKPPKIRHIHRNCTCRRESAVKSSA